MRALVTGAAGFVGRRLCAHLDAQGWDVVGCDICSTPPGPQSPSWLRCDISDEGTVASLFEHAGPITHVFHLAAVTFVPDANRDPGLAFAVNLAGTRHLVLNMLAHAPQARLLFVATADMYGPPQSLPITESHPLHPANPYSESKMAAEACCLTAHQTQGLDFVGMRPFNHTGPGQSEKFVLPSFACQIARAEAGRQPAELRVGNLSAARDFTHVDDVVRAYELAALHGRTGEIYNVCSGRSIVIADALDQMLAMSEVQMHVKTDQDMVRGAESTEVRGSHDKLTAATGWEPLISFEGLLGDLLGYWRSR